MRLPICMCFIVCAYVCVCLHDCVFVLLSMGHVPDNKLIELVINGNFGHICYRFRDIDA